jgi:hypothetical protein
MEEADQRANLAEQALNKVRAKSVFSPDRAVKKPVYPRVKNHYKN